MNQQKEENDRRNHFMINLHESMGQDRDRTRNPWICSQTRICSKTRYRLRYAAWPLPSYLFSYNMDVSVYIAINILEM